MPMIPADLTQLQSYFTQQQSYLVGVAQLQAEEALNDSDKSLTVPAGKAWELLQVWAELVTTATVGNRQMTLEIQDGAADVVARIAAGAVQAASLTRNYLFAPHMPDLTAFRAGDLLTTPVPPLLLPAGFIVRVYDSAAVAAAADDLVVQALVAERTPA